jgi:hypothetical protein
MIRFADVDIYNIFSRICKMRISFLNICIRVVFLATAFVWLLQLLSSIYYLGTRLFGLILVF